MKAVRKTAGVAFFWKLHPWLYRVTGGLVGGRIGGVPVLLLETTGRKSGVTRTNALFYTPDGDRHILVASNAGEPSHPAWYLNLKANPQVMVQVGSRRVAMRARDTEGDERLACWQKATAVYPGYEEYTQVTSRIIPVVVLEPGK